MKTNVELIAEVSSNHGGSLPLAKEFIQRFAEAGATTIKFQTTRIAHLNPADPQYAWFKQAEIPDDGFHEIKAVCEAAGVQFLTTIYNVAEMPLMVELGMTRVKLGAGEMHNEALAQAVRHKGIAPLRSFHALSHPLPSAGVDRWLSTVCRYPASERACLYAIQAVGGGDAVAGYSDHSVGIEMSKWAIECGAQIVEKHVRLPNQAREGKCYEATVEEFRQLRKFADDGPERFHGRWQFA